MDKPDSERILITGATGLVGSHVVEQALQKGLRVRALCRKGSDTQLLKQWGAEVCAGDLDDADSLKRACDRASIVVHCAAMVGDWGPTAEYRKVNVEGTRNLLEASLNSECLRRWIQISSLGVYSGTDHYGTDETTPPDSAGIDGYTLTKVESEQLVMDYIRTRSLPAIILRPGFIYGPRDRTVMPRLMDRLSRQKFAYLGNTDRLMNNTFVGNLCEAIWLAISNDRCVGEVFNIRDGRAVSKREFIETVCQAAGYQIPTKVIPLPVAQFLAWHMEKLWKLLRRKQAPLVNSARIKFLGRNLDFCIEKVQLRLGYQPGTDFTAGMQQTVAWFLSASESSGAERHKT